MQQFLNHGGRENLPHPNAGGASHGPLGTFDQAVTYVRGLRAAGNCGLLATLDAFRRPRCRREGHNDATDHAATLTLALAGGGNRSRLRPRTSRSRPSTWPRRPTSAGPFVALEIAAVVLAGALVSRDTQAVWWATTAVPALAILAYVVTRSVALPQIADDIGNWTEPLGIVALTAEALLIAIAVAHNRRSRQASRMVTRPLLLAGLVLAVGLVATGYAAIVSTA